jgi:aryl-alcohol dehydrogenase-like predicted oxidoreductase
MKARRFGSTGREVSPIGFGTWPIGADWGPVDERDALAVLNAALDRGVDFIDTADVYGDGRPEKLVAQVLTSRAGKPAPMVATTAGRRHNPPDGYNRANLTAFVERSLKYLAVDSLDLVQLHCPPTSISCGLPASALRRAHQRAAMARCNCPRSAPFSGPAA